MNLTAYFFFTKSFFLSVLPFTISYGNICNMKQKILNHWENIKNPSQNYFFFNDLPVSKQLRIAASVLGYVGGFFFLLTCYIYVP